MTAHISPYHSRAIPDCQVHKDQDHLSINAIDKLKNLISKSLRGSDLAEVVIHAKSIRIHSKTLNQPSKVPGVFHEITYKYHSPNSPEGSKVGVLALSQKDYDEINRAIYSDAKKEFSKIKPENVTPHIAKINKAVAPIYHALKTANTNFGVDRNALNAAVGLMGFLLFVLAILPGGLPLYAIIITGVVLAVLVASVLCYNVYTKKMSPLQAIIYGLIILTMLGCSLSPIGSTALLVSKIAYGVIAFTQGVVFGVARGALGSMDEYQKLRLAQRQSQASGDKSTNWNEILGFTGANLTILKGCGYGAMGILKILSVLIPGCDKIAEALWITSYTVYFALNNLSLIPKIITTYMDNRKYTHLLENSGIPGSNKTVKYSRSILNWMKSNLIREKELTEDLKSSIKKCMINCRNAQRLSNKKTPEISDLEKIEELINSMKKMADDSMAPETVTKLIEKQMCILENNRWLAFEQFKAHLLYMILGTLFIVVGNVLLSNSAILDHLFPGDINVGHNPLTGKIASAREMFQDGGQAVSSGFKGMFASEYNQDVRKYEQMAAELQTEATPPQYRDYWYELQLKIEMSTKKAIDSIGAFLGGLRQRASMPHKRSRHSLYSEEPGMTGNESAAM